MTAIRGLSTRRNRYRGRKKPALRIQIGEVALEIPHQAARGLSKEGLQRRIDAIARRLGIDPPTVTLHQNRDGSWAIAMGDVPERFVWPEDEGRRRVTARAPAGVERG